MVYIVLIVLGLCFGSFVNALVWRLREQAKPSKKRLAKKQDLSILKGRSMCVHCGHTLSAQDLLPVVSWLSLGGKCRYCSKPISWQYPVVELTTAFLFVLSYAFWPNFQNMTPGDFHLLQFGIWLCAVVVGTALTVYDFKWMELPDKLVKILAIFGVAFFIVASWDNFSLSTIYNLLAAIFVSGGIFYVLYQISDRLIGGGDVKMGLSLGFFLATPLNSALMLFMSSLLGCVYALIIVLIGKYKKGVQIPYGPYLLLATYLVVVFGERFIEFYENLLFLG